MKSAENMKKAWNEYIEAERLYDIADAAWEIDPENEELEAAWDDAAQHSFVTRETFCKELESWTDGAISKETARMMVIRKFDELSALVSMAA